MSVARIILSPSLPIAPRLVKLRAGPETAVGMATGPVAGGLIYDTFATYTWLYVGAWGIGIGAFLIAMTFRPFPKSQPAPAAA